MTPPFEKICVVGLGYVGLPTAAVIAGRGVPVLGVDINTVIVETINRGRIHIVEPGLEDLVNGAVTSGNLKAATAPEAADAFIIAVPTPFADGNKPDLTHLKAAAKALAPVLKEGDLIVIESTSPVGTTRAFSQWLAGHRPDLTFPHDAGEESRVRVAHSPERVLPGHVLRELAQNDRVVGGLSPRCAARAVEFYQIFVEGECLITDAATAELVKLAENAYRDVNIAYANELSRVAGHLGVDVWDVVELANRHPRVDILKPGPGVGGHCIAVDPWFIVDSAPEVTDLIRAARRVNDAKPAYVANLVLDAARGRDRPAVACLGLAYKADTDDLRESPAVEIVKLLADGLEGDILVVEPHVDALPASLEGLAGVRMTDLEEAISKAQIVVLLADHRAFLSMDTSMLEGKAVIDTRGAWRSRAD